MRPPGLCGAPQRAEHQPAGETGATWALMAWEMRRCATHCYRVCMLCLSESVINAASSLHRFLPCGTSWQMCIVSDLPALPSYMELNVHHPCASSQVGASLQASPSKHASSLCHSTFVIQAMITGRHCLSSRWRRATMVGQVIKPPGQAIPDYYFLSLTWCWCWPPCC